MDSDSDSERSTNSSFTGDSPPRRRYEPMVKEDKRKDIDSIDKLWQLLWFCIIIMILSSYNFIPWSYSLSSASSPIKPKCQFLHLQKLFPEQDNQLWISLNVGVQSVLKKNKPTTFLFVHSEDGFIAETLLGHIINTTKGCLGKNVNPLMLNEKHFSSPEFQNDYGLGIKEYKEPLRNSGIMLVENFDRIPPTVAQIFHTISDSENPLIEQSVMFLVMSIDGNVNENLNKRVNRKLVDIWSSLPHNIVQPLIARITEVPLLIKTF